MSAQLRDHNCEITVENAQLWKHKGEIRDDGWTMGNEWMEDVWLVDWLIGCLDGSMECWMTERAKPGHDEEVTRSLVFLVIFATNLQHVAKLNCAG